MRVKICGITNYKDAIDAIEAGADALGFVFYPKSPRYIDPYQAKEIISKLPPFVEKVALFVNEEAKTINSICTDIGATLAQIHFDASPSFYQELHVPYLQVIRATHAEDITSSCDTYRLIDAYCESYGGSGKRLNIDWFKDVDCSKIILAGGLNPSNVAALSQYNFYGVDVSSGVEQSYGKKDITKVREFITNAKS